MSKKKGLAIMDGLASLMSKKKAPKPEQDDSAIDGIPEASEKESSEESLLPKKKMSGKQMAAMKQKGK